ncbi:MAG: helix-turn-helix domain-containing protein [Marinilabiliaceae bacterium]|nr:helix-turn-helix domain-containing protein [Marinilabiliaceae bacterium]
MELIITTPDQLQTTIEQAINKALSRVPTIEPKADEEYLTADEVADKLKISLVTLWSWDRKGITSPVRIGNMKRYRKSELDKAFERIPPIKERRRKSISNER